MQVGTYTANGVKENGNWSQTPGVPMTEQLIDAVGLYASKEIRVRVRVRACAHPRRCMYADPCVPVGLCFYSDDSSIDDSQETATRRLCRC